MQLIIQSSATLCEKWFNLPVLHIHYLMEVFNCIDQVCDYLFSLFVH